MDAVAAAEDHYFNEETEPSLKAYAQVLDAAGNELGKLIALEMEAELDPNATFHSCPPEIKSLRKKVLSPHLQPRVLPAHLKWSNGLVTSASVGGHIRKQDKWLGVVLSNRAGQAIRHIEFKHSKETCNYKRALKMIVEKGTPNLRHLELSQTGSTGFDGLKGLSESAPRLEVLRLRGKMNPGAFKALGATWPKLHTLVVDFDLTPVWEKPQPGKKIAKLFASGTLPNLRVLRLERTGLDDALLGLIAEADILDGLEYLQVGGFFTKEAADAFFSQVPQSCQCIITRYEAHSDHQKAVEIQHRGVSPQQDQEYASLWDELEETDWWETGVTFEGAQIDHMPRNASFTSSSLPDGTLHGRQSKWQVRNGETTFRYDSMYWYGVEHGAAYIRNNGETENRRFINGLRDEQSEVFASDGTLLKRWVFSQGVKIEDFNASRDQFLAAEATLHDRFGREFTSEGNALFTVGPGQALRVEQEAVPFIHRNKNRTDNGMRSHVLRLADGSSAEVVLWTAGDTTCGAILDGVKLLGVIEDLEIRLPAQ